MQEVPDRLVGDLVRCRCLEQQITERQTQAKATRAAELTQELQRNLGRLRDCTFDTFNPAWSEQTEQRAIIRSVYHACQEYAAQGRPERWLYLWGPRGTGKSHLAAAIAYARAGCGVEVAYVTVPRMLAFLREGFGDRTADERLNYLCAVPLLILDDLGSEQQTEWSKAQMFLLINDRYLHERPTVITSNLSLDGEGIEGRIEDRMYEMSERIYLPGPGYRRRGDGR
jgi:DNA replication protein DnaC